MAVHHFVPQFYLKNFAISSSDPRVWVYRRTGEPQKLPIKTIAAVQGFYKVTISATGEKSEVVEQLFAQVEGQVKPLLIGYSKPRHPFPFRLRNLVFWRISSRSCICAADHFVQRPII